MPTSQVHSVPIVVQAVRMLRPKSILDVGCGFGKYGFLFREQLDIVDDQYSGAEDYRINRSNWRTRIDAVEVHQNYICEIQRYVYTNVYIGNIVDLVGDLPSYDVTLLADIIEHFEKEQGRRILDKLYDKTNKLVIITTPLFECEQPALLGNEFEAHRSVWRPRDFVKYPNSRIVKVSNRTLCVLLFKDDAAGVLRERSAGVGASDRIKALVLDMFGDKTGGLLIGCVRRAKRRLLGRVES